jgi:hypothetical protein
MNYNRIGLFKGAMCPANFTKRWKFSLLWAVTWEMRLAIRAARRHKPMKDNLLLLLLLLLRRR